ELSEQVSIAGDEPIFRNDANRIPEPRQYFKAGARDFESPFDGLIRVSDAADCNNLRAPLAGRELRIKQLGRVCLYHYPRLEVCSCRKTKVLVSRSSIAIDATVFASAIRVQACFKSNIGTVVPRDDGLGNVRVKNGFLWARFRV